MLAIRVHPASVVDAGHHYVDTRSKSQHQGKVTRKGTYVRKKDGVNIEKQVSLIYQMVERKMSPITLRREVAIIPRSLDIAK